MEARKTKLSRPNHRLKPIARKNALRFSGTLCVVVLKSYMTILHCLANEIYLELLG